VRDLQTLLDKAERARRDAQNSLSNGIQNWSFKIKTFADQQAERKRERDDKIKEIADLLNRLKNCQQTENQLIQEKQTLL